MVQILCENGAQPNATAADDMTSLHFAAQKGHLESLRLLLVSRAKASAVTRKGFTALHFAVSNGSLECVRALGKKSPEALGWVNSKGQLPVDLAKSDEMKELLQTLEVEAAALQEKKVVQAKEKEEKQKDALGSKRKKHGSKEWGREEGDGPMGELGNETTENNESGPMMRGDAGGNGLLEREGEWDSLRDDVANEGDDTLGESIGPMMRPTSKDEVDVSTKERQKRGGDDKVGGGKDGNVGEVRLTALQRAKLKMKKPKIGLSHLEADE